MIGTEVRMKYKGYWIEESKFEKNVFFITKDNFVISTVIGIEKAKRTIDGLVD